MHYAPIAAVLRAAIYSPNHICNDAAILNNVVEQLRKRGCMVNIYSEEQFNNTEISEPVIINMCRELSSIHKLQEAEDNGKLVLNSGYGIENCIRERMARIIMGHSIPYPDSLIVSTDEKIKDELIARGFNNCWVKRGEFHSMHKEDVSYVRHPQEAQELLQEYFLRGIKRAVINKHHVGDLVKFYGISGTNFFYWFHPFDDMRGNISHEHNTEKELNFNVGDLHDMIEKVADLLDVRIYGGDCIIGEAGQITLIDFNDWPSFAPCRDQAALNIAKYVLSNMKAKGFATK